jgi:hypothetical protein
MISLPKFSIQDQEDLCDSAAVRVANPKLPTHAGQSVEFVGGTSRKRIVITKREDQYFDVSSPDDSTFAGVLWRTDEPGYDLDDDCFEVSVPPHFGGSGLEWSELLAYI